MSGMVDVSGERIDGAKAITPARFWHTFQTVSSGRYVSGGRHYWRPSSRTKELLDKEIHLPGRQASGLLWLVAENLGLDYRREFFGYDVIFHSGHVQRGRWKQPADISVVLEHENDAKTSHHELYRLSLMAVPLKVLITYPEDFGDTGELLEWYLSVLDDAPVDPTGAFLVIFGVPERPRRTANWIAYEYSTENDTFDFLPELSP